MPSRVVYLVIIPVYQTATNFFRRQLRHEQKFAGEDCSKEPAQPLLATRPITRPIFAEFRRCHGITRGRRQAMHERLQQAGSAGWGRDGWL